ncbi:hypothetical protein [Legionella sp. CNM-4043-24]|uniref:hypothetical protein n=1 Tax=Legionella sp. CNM-4043-24 TaxID=3421646 RepID=UPI00403B251D
MSKYPTTKRGSSIETQLPNKDAFLKMFDIISRSETADYAVKCCRAIAGLPADVLKVVENFAKKMHFQDDGRTNPFFGKPNEIRNTDEHFQKMAALDAAGVILEQVPQNLHIGFAANSESKLLRAVSVNKKLVDEQVSSAQDTLFSAWLYTHHAVCEDGTIYKTVDVTENNLHSRRIATDANNEPVTFPVEQFTRLMTDPGKDGYAAFLKNHGIDATIQKRPYPESRVTPEQTAQPVAQTVAPARPVVETQNEQTPSPD